MSSKFRNLKQIKTHILVKGYEVLITPLKDPRKLTLVLLGLLSLNLSFLWKTESDELAALQGYYSRPYFNKLEWASHQSPTVEECKDSGIPMLNLMIPLSPNKKLRTEELAEIVKKINPSPQVNAQGDKEEENDSHQKKEKKVKAAQTINYGIDIEEDAEEKNINANAVKDEVGPDLEEDQNQKGFVKASVEDSVEESHRNKSAKRKSKKSQKEELALDDEFENQEEGKDQNQLDLIEAQCPKINGEVSLKCASKKFHLLAQKLNKKENGTAQLMELFNDHIKYDLDNTFSVADGGDYDTVVDRLDLVQRMLKDKYIMRHDQIKSELKSLQRKGHEAIVHMVSDKMTHSRNDEDEEELKESIEFAENALENIEGRDSLKFKSQVTALIKTADVARLERLIQNKYYPAQSLAQVDPYTAQQLMNEFQNERRNFLFNYQTHLSDLSHSYLNGLELNDRAQAFNDFNQVYRLPMMTYYNAFNTGSIDALQIPKVNLVSTQAIDPVVQIPVTNPQAPLSVATTTGLQPLSTLNSRVTLGGQGILNQRLNNVNVNANAYYGQPHRMQVGGYPGAVYPPTQNYSPNQAYPPAYSPHQFQLMPGGNRNGPRGY